jgi:peptidoglycan hydrolase-like protein with peptidoglycan-binding domain
MRSMLSATLMIAAIVPAQAQVAPPATAARPKPAIATPARPALQTPADTANAMMQAERLAIQSDLAWNGDYNGAINGEVSERMVAAIRSFQKDNGGRETGVLNPQERGILTAAARKHQDNVGWRMITDMVTGARLGIPGKLVPQQASDMNGSKWSSSTGTIQIVLARRREDAPSTAKLAELERNEPGRKVDYSVVKPDFFVLSGMQGLKKFYIRGQFRESEVRILTILYDQATEGTMAPVVIAMSSAFNPFPAAAQASGPPPRKKVEYASGIVVGNDGAIVTDRAAVDGCLSIVVAGHGHADKIAEDKIRDLALLRIYGAHGLTPLALGGGVPTKPAFDLVGIADPQSQGGAGAVSRVRAAAAPAAAAGEIALQPPPGPGFSGAAAIDGDGAFAGLAQLKPLVLAGPGGTGATQAVLVPADAVRAFVKGNGVTNGGAADTNAAVVRVICVRK